MKTIILFLALSGLVACSDSKPASTSKETDPTTVTSRKLVEMKELTSSQKKEIQTIMQGLRLVPDTFLYLVGTDESAATKKSRAEKIQWLQGYDLQVYNSILAQCDLKNPVMMVQTDVEGIGASITGNNCAIQYEEFSTASTSKFTKTISSPDLQAKTGLLSMAMISNTVTTLQTNQSNINLTLTTVEGKTVDITTTRESLQRRRTDQSYTEMKFQFPSAAANVQIFRESGRQRFYLNGKASDAAEIKDLFGYDL